MRKRAVAAEPEKRPVGRPVTEDPRSVRLQTLVTEAEADAIRKASGKATISDWLRDVAKRAAKRVRR